MVKNNKNNESQVEDIFSDTNPDKKPSARTFNKKTVEKSAAGTVSAGAPSMKRSKLPKILMFVFIAVVAIGAVAYLLTSDVFKADKSNKSNASVVNSSTTVINNTNTQTPTVELPVIKATTDDTDGDGLTDEIEKELGTKPDSKDSDSDQLFDREEVMVYKTNPLKQDTDGDGNIDGVEVANGFNPNGSGNLLDLEAEIKNLE